MSDRYQRGSWDGDEYYERACTPEEAELLDANLAAAEAEDRVEAEAERDQWFAKLKAELRPSSRA